MKKKIAVLLVAMVLSAFGQMPNADSAAVLVPGTVYASTVDSVHSDSLSKPTQAKKLRIIKRSINYSVAAKFAIGTMLFIAFLLTAGDAWNPGE